MIDIFKAYGYESTTFIPFTDYLKTLETDDYIQISYQEKNGYQEFNLTYKDELVDVLGLKERDYEWITIYRTNSKGEVYEQIEFMIYLPNCELDQDHNRIVQYSAHFDDETYSRIVWSSFFYKDNKYLQGKRELRKITIEDLAKIFYSKTMNLTELVSLADQKIEEFASKISLKEDEVKELKLEY